jgi:serine/threonine protein kinase/nitrite reductase/ring-hydroxylating ferredoxin subunit
MHVTSPDQLVGHNIEPYRVERLLRRSHINAVYLAYHAIQNSPVALMTFILPETLAFEARQRFWERFWKEAAKLTTLRHTHILSIHDYGMYAGYPYIVIPFMKYISLADILKRRGRLHHTEVRHILQQVATGLAYAHEKGIFHGALKPSNIILNNREEVLVTGFGLMEILQMRGIEQDESRYGHLLSIAGTFLAPEKYVAPEVVLGRPAGAHTDVYALGVILLESLSGKLPFTGTNPLEVAMQHVQRPVLCLRTDCPDIPLTLAAVVNQALDRDPERRFQHVDELAEAFVRISVGLSENDTNNRMRAVRDIGQETLPDWQFLPPVITGQLPVLEPTAQATNDQELALLAPPTKVSPTFVPPAEKLAVTTRSLQETSDASWTLPPQELSPPPRSDSTQQNAKLTRRGPISNKHSRPWGRGKTRGNESISRRMVVALLVTGGVAIAGTAVAIASANAVSNQQAQNNVANLARNAVMNFVNPANNKAGVLVHLVNGNFVAYERACTHQGVYVKYDPTKQLLVCPAHGATFDPAHGGAVRQGPATKPLPAMTVHVEADGTIVIG